MPISATLFGCRGSCECAVIYMEDAPSQLVPQYPLQRCNIEQALRGAAMSVLPCEALEATKTLGNSLASAASFTSMQLQEGMLRMMPLKAHSC